ncbi:MAG TPA: flagellar hook assembly protein FlgD [Gammaproteobacteria bacterium]|nr:flagellar hook assembly protein FlgD [Gammaproteobacteria bacterium]
MSSIDQSTLSSLKELGLTRQKQDAQERDKKTEDMGQDEFLNLMIAQLKNQDPTNPTDSSQFMTEIAQFTAASGINELQSSFDEFAGSMRSNRALQASTLVGRTVSVPSDAGYLPQGGSMTGEVDIPSGTQNAVVGVYDQAGQLVHRIDLGMQGAGKVPFQWDGTTADGQQLPSGAYHIKGEALIEGKMQGVDTNTYAEVESVDLGGSGGDIRLNLSGLGATSFSDVKQIM